jgi:membrane associated rhomboid family serine protease
MTRPVNSVAHEAPLRRVISVPLGFVAVLWLLQLGAALFDVDLTSYGIYPRRLSGTIGIAMAPLIHGSFSHLIANSLPLMLLGSALFYGYPRSARVVIGCLYAGTGIGVWLIAREAYHIGASGLATGMMFFLFVIGAIRWDRRAIVLSMLAFFLYGSMFWGILPGDPDVSFESHLCGAVIGVGLAIVLRNNDPAPPRTRYSWEDEEGVGEVASDGGVSGETDGDSARDERPWLR